MRRRSKGGYFRPRKGAPEPVVAEVHTSVKFNECDVMGFVWFGNYLRYFEEGSAAAGKKCGLGYKDFFEAGLRTPIVESHVEYLNPLFIDEEFTIRTIVHYNEAATIQKEYRIIKADGTLAASGYTVQLFIGSDGSHMALSPPILEETRRRWRAGEFHG